MNKIIKFFREVNVFVLFLICILTCVEVFFVSKMIYDIIYIFLLFIFMSLLGCIKTGIKFLLVYAILPIAMAGAFILEIPSGKVTEALRKLPIPNEILLTVIVVLRFIPTMISEFSDVSTAMRTRGFLRSPFYVLLRPLRTIEYLIVPMVFRSLKIADELAASCIVRGIESPYKKNSYYLNKVRILDIFILLVFLITTIILVIL